MKKIFLIAILTFILTPIIGIQVLFAQEAATCKPSTEANSKGEMVCSLENPIGVGQKGTTEVGDVINIVIKTALGIIGGLTLLMFVYGGFQWLTSAGNPEKVSAGTQTMVWAVIGVILVLASYILLSTFLSYLTGKA